MAMDLAIDFNTGDLVIAPNKDIDVRIGQATVDQRIRVRLRVPQGDWSLDPSGGLLGSRLHDAVRLPIWRAEGEVPLLVHEALLGMHDIAVREVKVSQNAKSHTTLDMTILYSMLDESGQTMGEVLTTNISVTG